MTRIEKLNQLQSKILEKIEENGFKGTVMSCPGSGKTFLSFKYLYRLLELGLIPKNATVVFLAETVTREKTLLNDEIPKFKKVYDKEVLSDFNFNFHCYQAKPDQIYNDFEKADVVVGDELHETLTDSRHNIITDNKCKYVLGLTGAMSLEQNVFPSQVDSELLNNISQSDESTRKKEITEFVTKGQLLEMYLPVIFKYPTSQAIEDGIIAEYRSIVIDHHLDNSNKNIKIWKSYATLGTEFDYYDKRKTKLYDWRQKAYTKKRMGREMSAFLYELPSKTNVVKAILHRLGDEKTLVFGERLDALQKITPNVARSGNYAELIDAFNKGDINVIASSKMLKQGITLTGVQNIIFHSYNSKWHNMEQRRARVRWLDGDQAKLFFVVTKGTLEEKWFGSLKKEKNSKGRTIQEHDLNIRSYVDSRLLVNWYKKQI